jgi:hypothetical protein
MKRAPVFSEKADTSVGWDFCENVLTERVQLEFTSPPPPAIFCQRGCESKGYEKQENSERGGNSVSDHVINMLSEAQHCSYAFQQGFKFNGLGINGY